MMLRHDVQEKTGLTRRAIDYYEEKGLISPQKSENGYREFTEEDVKCLTDISLLRRLDLSITEIKTYLSSDSYSLATFLREKEHEIALALKKQSVLGLIMKGEDRAVIETQLLMIEAEETIYEKLLKAFPGYLGQMLFSSYQSFFNTPLDKENEPAYLAYLKYLDELPPFELNDEEQGEIDFLSSEIAMKDLKKINDNKIAAVKDAKEWLVKNKAILDQYEAFKNSDDYQNSVIKKVQDKLRQYLLDNDYYDTAIPLIRQFSKSYDDYYQNLIKADEAYFTDKNT